MYDKSFKNIKESTRTDRERHASPLQLKRKFLYSGSSPKRTHRLQFLPKRKKKKTVKSKSVTKNSFR
jgi:hypothetical protein